MARAAHLLAEPLRHAVLDQVAERAVVLADAVALHSTAQVAGSDRGELNEVRGGQDIGVGSTN